MHIICMVKLLDPEWSRDYFMNYVSYVINDKYSNLIILQEWDLSINCTLCELL